MRTIGGLFGRSAWGPLWEHLAKARDCLVLLRSSTESFIAGKYTKLDELARKVARLEKDADTIKENIRQRLSRSMFSSVERSDILAWLRQQDGIADSCEDVVKLFSLRETKVVKELKLPLIRLVDRIVLMMDELIEAVKVFGQIAASEPTKKELDRLSGLIANTQKGKDEVDMLQMEFLKKLFKVEDKMDPVSIFFLRDAGEKISRIADRIENVGDLIRHMVSK